MVTSGTGHDRCPSPGPGPLGARTPPSGGDKKISKTAFGFKRGQKNFCLGAFGYEFRPAAVMGGHWTRQRIAHNRGATALPVECKSALAKHLGDQEVGFGYVRHWPVRDLSGSAEEVQRG